MSAWVCVAGGTLLIPSNGFHLHIILNDPCIFDGYKHEQCILVGISTVRKAPYDQTCIIEAGAHDFIKNQSYAYYRKARLDFVSHLNSMVRVNSFRPHNPATIELLDAVRNGLHKSKQTKKHIIDLKRA